MRPAPRRHRHPSSGANRSSDIGETVNINAEFNLIAVDPMIECISRDLVTEYCQGVESSAVYPAPPFSVKTLRGWSNWSLPRLQLHMHAQAISPTFLTLNVYIGFCLRNALTLSRLRPYNMFEVLSIVRINKSMGLQGILNFRLLRDAFPYRLA